MENNFSFGSPEQTAQLYYDNVATVGPKLPDVHPDELTQHQMIDKMVYLGIAVTNAKADGEEAVVDVLFSHFDELFVALVETDEAYKQRLVNGALRLPRDDRRRRNHGHYLRLAGL